MNTTGSGSYDNDHEQTSPVVGDGDQQPAETTSTDSQFEFVGQVSFPILLLRKHHVELNDTFYLRTISREMGHNVSITFFTYPVFF